MRREELSLKRQRKADLRDVAKRRRLATEAATWEQRERMAADAGLDAAQFAALADKWEEHNMVSLEGVDFSAPEAQEEGAHSSGQSNHLPVPRLPCPRTDEGRYGTQRILLPTRCYTSSMREGVLT